MGVLRVKNLKKMGGSSSESGPGAVLSDRYVIFLVLIAQSGWTLASYDFNLLVVALPDISKNLHLTASFVGLLGFIIYAAMFGITLFAGYGQTVAKRIGSSLTSQGARERRPKLSRSGARLCLSGFRAAAALSS